MKGLLILLNKILQETAPLKLTRMTIEKCTMVNISSFIFTLFTIYLFIFCYCFPLSLVAFFYAKLLRRLRQHARQFKVCWISEFKLTFAIRVILIITEYA